MTPPNYHSLAAEVTAHSIQLEARRLRSQCFVDPRFLDSVRPSIVLDAVAQRMILEMVATVASRKYAVKTVRFPADWWQAVKLRFMDRKWRLARWYLEKHPVIYTEVTLEASAYYPEVHIEGQQAFVEIIQRCQSRQ